jgi:hypothetical protein
MSDGEGLERAPGQIRKTIRSDCENQIVETGIKHQSVKDVQKAEGNRKKS